MWLQQCLNSKIVKGDINVAAAPVTQAVFKNCAFTKCTTEIDETTIENAEDLDLVEPIYNLVEYSSNYSKTTVTSWFYSKDEAANFNADIANDNNFKSFEYKPKLLENTVAQPYSNNANGILRNATIAVPLKYFCNFWRSLEMPLIAKLN